MWALYVVGPPLEMWLGRLRFGALYALSLLGGSVLVYLLAPLNTATAGASGAVFGLFGATFVVAKRLNLDVRWVVAVVVINLVFTFVARRQRNRSAGRGTSAGWSPARLVAAAYVYAPRARRNLIQAGVTAAVLGGVHRAGLVAHRQSSRRVRCLLSYGEQTQKLLKTSLEF